MPVSMSENLKLEEGEMICDKCDGKGTITSRIDTNCASMCQKCQGLGKVDWVENIVGKKPEGIGMSSSSGPSCGSTSISSGFGPNGVHDDIVDALAKEFANEIDKEIIESLCLQSERIDKKMKTAASIMAEMGGIVFDNRIIS